MLGAPDGSAACGFQPLRQVGKALDVELLLLRSRSGPVTSSDKLRHPLRGPPPPLRLADSLKAEFRRPAQVPVNPPFPTVQKKGASVEAPLIQSVYLVATFFCVKYEVG